MSTDLQVMDETSGTELQSELLTSSNLLSAERFALTDKYALAISRATLLPNHLRGDSPEEAYSNCFLVVNQALTWGVDPLAVAQATSVIHGKLCYEGKLVQAVLNMNGIRLHTRYEGERGSKDYKIYLSDEPFANDGSTHGREMEGSVEDWGTTGTKGENSGKLNSAWQKDPYSMLHYRGHRQWARLHEPGLIMGVYTPDEMANEADEQRARKARDITKKTEHNPLLSPEDRGNRQQTSQAAQTHTGASGKERAKSEDGGQTAAASSSDAPLKVSMSRDTFDLYASNLINVRTMETLKKGDAKFASGLKAKPNDADVALSKAIFDAIANRIKNEISAQDCSAHIRDLIEEAFKC